MPQAQSSQKATIYVTPSAKGLTAVITFPCPIVQAQVSARIGKSNPAVGRGKKPALIIGFSGNNRMAVVSPNGGFTPTQLLERAKTMVGAVGFDYRVIAPPVPRRR